MKLKLGNGASQKVGRQRKQAAKFVEKCAVTLQAEFTVWPHATCHFQLDGVIGVLRM